MKSVVCNVCGMAAAVACLALILNRPAGAEAPEKQEVKEVTSTVVVQADQVDTDVAEALQKTLHEQMEGLPQEIHEKIKQKLQAVKGLQHFKVEAHPVHKIISARQPDRKPGEAVRTIVVTVDGDGQPNVQEVTTGETAAKAKKRVEAKLKKAAEAHKKADGQQKVTITTQASPDREEKQIRIASAVDDDEISAKEVAKTVTVTLEDGKLVVNGKPLELPIFTKSGECEIKVEVKNAAGDEAKKAVRRKMIFMGEDGKAQEFSFDDVDVDHFVVGKPHAEKTATATAHAVIVAIDADQKDGEGQKARVHTWTMQLDPKMVKGPHNVLMLGSAGGRSPLPHAVHFDPAQADKSHAEVRKRLKGIESELKKIRKLLEQMQKGDHEEDDDD